MFGITDDVRITRLRPLIPPAILMEEFPVTAKNADKIIRFRKEINDCLYNRTNKMLVVVGPCSINDPKATLEYAKKLKIFADKYKDKLLIVMRVYFEKPRTTVGWKGLINDPDLDESFNINKGLKIARKLLIDLIDMNMPVGCEYLDTIMPQFYADLISWGAIGARTTESQCHRELASGLSAPIGFKNGTNGDIQIAIDAIKAAKNIHHFLSVTKHGSAAIVETKGNENCHIILRGGTNLTNYDSASIKNVSKQLEKEGLNNRVMVDCSHANSKKDFKEQIKVLDDIISQYNAGERNIFGIMLESYLKEGSQKIINNSDLEYGKSVTDSCIDWDTTEAILTKLAESVCVKG